jgi:SNF family Na+-dependent transporter
MAQVSELPPAVKQFQAWYLLIGGLITAIFGGGVIWAGLTGRITILEQNHQEISSEVKENRKVMTDIRDRLIRIEADVQYVKERGVK